MQVAVLERPGVVQVVERPAPEPAAGEVLVRVAAVGICGSDVHYYQHGRIGRYVVEQPLVLGHECAGTIVTIGPGVPAARVGQRVAVEPGVPCRRCRDCKAGRYNLCPNVEFLATPPVDGALAEYLAAPADFAHPIPDHLSFDEAALVEPTAVAVHAVRLGRVEPGLCCAVFGAGPVGLLVLQVARAFGATAVAVIDPEASRLELARALGADLTVDPRGGSVPAALAPVAPDGADVVFDASGSHAALAGTIEVARRGGRVVWIGLPAGDQLPIPAAMLIDKEIELRGVFRYANAHPLAVDLVASGRVRTAPLISHHFALAETAAALDLVARREGGVVKAVISP
jgi:L-iditol 2-dehydrogenase